MITLLTLIPWVLTVGALLFIIVRQQQFNNIENEFLDDDIFDEDDLITEDGQHTIIRAAVYEDKAYWVYQNVLYESEVTKEPDWETAKPVDAMTLPQKEINKLMKVLDELQDTDEGE